MLLLLESWLPVLSSSVIYVLTGPIVSYGFEVKDGRVRYVRDRGVSLSIRN